ncbi:hypothetical protein [Citricoccus sp. GCM10030269]|uniref:hypothetical protein n=1 Tax=Citricoccus sp. GCM10030269 TaxID=3273388 RepID=UPI00360C67A9
MPRLPRPRPDGPELEVVDPADGAWLAGMLEAGDKWAGSGRAAMIVPAGNPAPYEAIARIFHPVPWHHHRWDAAAADRWRSRGLEPESYWDAHRDGAASGGGLNAYGTTTWEQVAQEQGTEFHASAQWSDLSLSDDNGFAISRHDPDLQFGQVAFGHLASPTMAALAGVLLDHTTTPGQLVLGLWEGQSWLQGGGVRLTVMESDEFGRADGAGRAGRVRKTAREVLPPAFGPRTTAALRDDRRLLDVGDGYRRYLLVRDDGTALQRPVWRSAGLDQVEQSPQLAWPQDRAWTLASEIDVDSTLVAGSADLVRAICTHPELEAAAVRPDTDLTAFADTVNSRE